jgi:hypothetical protein
MTRYRSNRQLVVRTFALFVLVTQNENDEVKAQTHCIYIDDPILVKSN